MPITLGMFASRKTPVISQVYSSSNTSDLSTYTFSTVPIGAPSPTRRLLLYFMATFKPGTLNYSCTVNGVPATLQSAQLPNGSVLSSAFSFYTNRYILYVSDVISTGTTANIVIGTGLACNVMSVDVMTAEFLSSPSVRAEGSAASAVSLTVPQGGSVFFGKFGGSTSSLTNATTRIAVASGGSGDNVVWDYINTTASSQSLTFTGSPSGSTIYYSMFY